MFQVLYMIAFISDAAEYGILFWIWSDEEFIFHSSSKENDEAFIQEAEYKIDILQLKPFLFKSNVKVETVGSPTANHIFFCSHKY